MKRTNFHTHTPYCDGASSVQELINAALEAGACQLGFSGHSLVEEAPTVYDMSPEEAAAYRREIEEKKTEYQGRLSLFCGIEQDILSQAAPAGYDYVIGSVHLVRAPAGGIVPVDHGPDIAKNGVDTHFNGDFTAFVKAYYQLVAQVKKKTACHIVGHFDLIAKFNQTHRFFDEDSREYRFCAIEALERLSAQGAVLEINTGAISRRARTIPYPAPFLLQEMKRLHVPVCYSSDAHHMDHLFFMEKEVRELIREYQLTQLETMEDILAYRP